MGYGVQIASIDSSEVGRDTGHPFNSTPVGGQLRCGMDTLRVRDIPFRADHCEDPTAQPVIVDYTNMQLACRDIECHRMHRRSLRALPSSYESHVCMLDTLITLLF